MIRNVVEHVLELVQEHVAVLATRHVEIARVKVECKVHVGVALGRRTTTTANTTTAVLSIRVTVVHATVCR